MAEPSLLKTIAGEPGPQYENDAGTAHESLQGRNGAAYGTLKDGAGNVVDSTNRLPTETVLTGSTVPDSEAIPTKRPGRVVTIANAVAITTTSPQNFNLITGGGLTEAEILSYTNFRVSVLNTHDQAADVRLFPNHSASGGIAGGTRIYSATGIVPATNGRVLFQSGDVGTGSLLVEVIPALRDVFSDLHVQIGFGITPTSGAVTIKVEMH